MKKYVKIDGIHCSHCIDTITNKLLTNKNITKVIIKNNIARITYEGKLSNKDIIKMIKEIDYFTKEEYISDNLSDLTKRTGPVEFVIITSIILLIGFIINKLFGYNIFNVIPNINANITYGMLFITGVLTSIHCVSMCGAINLLAVINSHKRNYKRPVLYNFGRVISYTVIGGIVGGIGSVLSFNDIVKGVIIILASIIMFLMALNMLGFLDFKLPFINKIRVHNKSHNALIIGLLNGLMPCGPLQAMQVYALSTGSVLKGALSMFLFSLGTVPLMLFVGIFYNLLKGKGRIIVNKIASVLILILSLFMLNRGLLALNIDITKGSKNYGDYTKAVLKDDYQVVKFNLEYSDYENVIVQKDIPVKMIIHVDEEYLTGCNNEVELKDFKQKIKLEVGDNEITFTPSEVGTYTYTCWMHMIKNNIKVIDDIDYFRGDQK